MAHDASGGPDYDELSIDEDAPLRLCKHQLEHEGGRFWCNLPLGHAGSHEPPPHEVEGYSNTKRQRAPPKRLSDEPELRRKKNARLKPRSSDTDEHEHKSDSDETGAAPAGGAGTLGQRPRKTKPTSRGGPGSRQPSAYVEPGGYLTLEQEEHRKQHVTPGALSELQTKLPEEMRSAGWLVIPKGVNAMESGHFFVRPPLPCTRLAPCRHRRARG
jgi:hypothetical protein